MVAGRPPAHPPSPRQKRAFASGGNDPAFFSMGLEETFFKTRPIVLSLARSTICSSTTFSSSNRKVQRANPGGGSEQAKAISLASLSPSKIRATGGVSRRLRLSTASSPPSNQLLANGVNHRVRRIEGLHNLSVAPALASLRHISFQQDLNPQQSPRRDRPLAPREPQDAPAPRRSTEPRTSLPQLRAQPSSPPSNRNAGGE